MPVLASLLVIALLLFGAFIAALNWSFHLETRRNRSSGIDRDVSPIALVAQLCAWIAAILASSAGIDWIPAWFYWGVALIDLGLWKLIAWPFFFAWYGVQRISTRERRALAVHHEGISS